MKTIRSPHNIETVINRSRFIASVDHVDSVEAAERFIESIRDPDAAHNCWAYKCGEQYRFSDDGEPGGTAGRPILSAIEHADLDNVAVMVTRFFGGIKLGAGGLVRAYGGTAASCLHTAEKVEIIPRTIIKVTVPFDLMGSIHSIISRMEITKREETFIQTGCIFVLDIESDAKETITSAIRDATRGMAEIQEMMKDE